MFDPRVWIIAVLLLLATFTGGFFYGEHKQAHLDKLERTAEIASANQEARQLEQKRQDNANAASTVAAKRAQSLVVDAANARRESSGLRNDADALKLASQKSISAALASLDLTTDLLDRCTERYSGMAENAQRADTEARQLREAWPK